jgi:hypothetical protein
VKVQIIHLDPEDDQNSAREKLRWTKAPRVVFVWPGRGRVLTRRVDLKLLQRQGDRQNAQIGIISHDPDVMHNADQLGIPIFESLDEIETGRWHPRPRSLSLDDLRPKDIETEARRHPQKAIQADHRALPTWLRYTIFSIGLILPMVVLLILLPSVKVVIAPKTSTEQMNTVFTLLAANPAELDSCELPARYISVQVEEILRIPTTGSSSQPENPAKGSVILNNVSTTTVTLAAGARLLPTDPEGPTFVTQSTVLVPPDGSANVEITALAPGPAGNLPAGTAWAIEGQAGLSLEVENPTPTRGGSLASRSAVSSSDLQTLQTQLAGQLLEKAQGQIEESLLETELLIPESLETLRLLRSTYDHRIGDIADSIALEMDIEAGGYVVDRSVLKTTAYQSLLADLPAGWHVIPASLTISQIAFLPPEAEGQPRLRAEFEAQIFKEPDRRRLVESLRLSSAAKRFMPDLKDEFDLVSIDLSPAWLPFYPPFTFQYQVLLPWELPS